MVNPIINKPIRGIIRNPRNDPVTAAVTAALVEAGVSAAVASIIASVAVNVVISVGLSVLTGALTKKPKPPASSNFTRQLRDRTLTARQPIAPRRIIYGDVRVGGTYTFIHTTGDSNEFLNLVITESGHQIEAFDGLYFDGVEVPLDVNGDATGDYAGHVHAEFNLGTDDQAAFPGLVAEAPDKWTADHRQLGCAGAYVRLKYDADKFPNGIPSITFQVRGKADVLDPRTALTGYTNNAALCIADYVSLTRLSLGASYGDEIIETDLIEAANICEEQVALLGGGNENRYEANGTLETDATPFENIKSLTGAMAGAAITQGKIWTFRAGAYRAPEISALTEDDFVGAITTQTLISRTQSFNGVKGVFTSPDNNWQPDDFPAVAVPAYVAADNDEEVWAEVTLPFTTSVSAAQRISRLMLELQRRQITTNVSCKMIAYQLQPFDTVPFTIERYGWSDKTFQVRKMRLILDQAWSVRLDTQEIDANAYAWSTSDESVYTAAPTTSLPNAFDIIPPGLTLGDEIVATPTGGAATNLIATLQAPSDVFVDRYDVEFKLSTDAEWSAMGNGPALIVKTSNVEDTLIYDVRARSINTFGVRSDWSDIKQRTIVGQTELPPDVIDFVVSIVDGAANLSWSPVEVVDLSHYRIKHSSVLSDATWASSTLLVDRVGKPATSIAVPALVGTYLIKAVDFGERESENPALIVSNVAALRTFNAVESVEEAPDFLGLKTQTIIDDGKLELDFQGDVFGRADFFGVADFFLGTEGHYSEGWYEFEDTIDLGEIYTSRVTASITAFGENYNSDVFLRPDFFDIVDFFDTAASSWGAMLQIRTTDDDPASSPVIWSAWQAFVTGDYNARALQFRVYLTSAEFGITPVVTQLGVTVDMPDETRAADDLVVTVAGLSVIFAPSFRSLKGLGISAQGLQTGDYYTITAKDESGYTIEFFDSSDTAVERTHDYVAVGYGRVE